MKITLENTTKLVTIVINGQEVPARIWQGTTESGIPIHCYITRIGVATGRPAEDYTQFEQELRETAQMRRDIESIPLRLIL